jgi:hypothetical protein
MAEKRDEDLKDSFYLYIMRSSIGAGLKSQYAPNGHMPDRLGKLMKELETGAGEHGAEEHGAEEHGAEEHGGEHKAAGQEQEEHKRPARKHVRKK